MLILALVLPALALAKKEMRSEVAFYIDTYGEVIAEEDTQVATAHRVFERVRAVADKSSKRLPKLVVVNSRSDSWAIALPSGHIVLSKRAVEICHKKANSAEAEARLAFVLGHELAHLANDDFWHKEIDGFLATSPKTEHIAHFINENHRAKEIEFAADDKGYIYAAMAGYSVDGLVEKESGQQDFFDFWVKQASSRLGSSHPSAKDRAALLRQRLTNLSEQIDFFNFGVRLSHFGHCKDGVYFLREFQKHFPGRAVLNNLGFCYLQMARRAMNDKRANFYWMPLHLDVETRARAVTRDSIASLEKSIGSLRDMSRNDSSKAKGFLEEAITYLDLAVKSDPAYIPARINLAVARLYLGQAHQARAILSEAKAISPTDRFIQGLDAVALFEQSDADADLWPMAIAKLEPLAAEKDASPIQLYNIARLLAIRPRGMQARIFWNRLASKADQLPVPIKSIVCQEQTSMTRKKCVQPATVKPVLARWKWPLSITKIEPLTAATQQQFLNGWKTKEFDWFGDKLYGSIHRQPDGKYQVLEMNRFVQMQVIKGDGSIPVNLLSKYCGQPLGHRQLALGHIWSCNNWAALAIDEKVREVWWVAK